MSQYVKPTLVVLNREISTIEIDGIHYVSARAIGDVFNLDWRTQKRQLSDPDSVVLYGVIDISAPEMAVIVSPDSRYSGRSDRADTIFVRMDRAMMFIARVSTANMRAKGNHEGAEAVLQKQIEFARALHEYESFGIAVKYGVADQRRKGQCVMLAAIRVKNQTQGQPERKLIEGMLAQQAAEYGLSYQPDLLDASA